MTDICVVLQIPITTSHTSRVNHSQFQSTAFQPQISALRQPKHPHYATEQHRVASFTGARVPRGQTVDVLAKAGFFHVGEWMLLLCIPFRV